MSGTAWVFGAFSVSLIISFNSFLLTFGKDVDVTNVIREVWGANNTQGWELGYLSNLDISAMDDDQIGMVVCWDGPT